VKYYSRKVTNTEYLPNTAYAAQKPLLHAMYAGKGVLPKIKLNKKSF
jgi:hypothetical protein